MTDVTVAPPSAAPDTPSNEVVIDQNPANAPAPVSNQPPEKAPSEKPQTRREAIQAAFDRANDPAKAKPKDASRPPPKAAEARPGHNKPPEETPAEGIDLKKRPGDQPLRTERGTFAPRAQTNATDPAHKPGTDQQPGQPDPRGYTQKLPPHAPYAEPPARMADHAKAEWHATPERVRGEIYRMHQEFQGAYERYRGAAEAFEPIRGYHEMAQQHGTTLDRALNNYVTMEQKLRQDVIGGLDVIVNNLNLRTSDGEKLDLRDICYHILNQSPDSHKLVQQQNAQAATAQQIGSLHQEIYGLKNELQQLQTGIQFNYTRSQVDQFADDGRHPRFDELGDLIKNELELGFDIEAAYRRAELLRPATHAAQTGNPSAQTRPTDRSIYGAPAAGPSNGTARRSDKPVGRREAISNAIRRVNGAA